jgi:hypothetical protein
MNAVTVAPRRGVSGHVRRTSALVALLLSLGSALILLAGCSRSEQPLVDAPAAKTQPPAVIPPPPRTAPSFVHDHYATLEDCVYDWGYAQKCVPTPSGSPMRQAGANFVGPIYARNYREETQAQLRREALAGGYAQQVVTDESDKSISKSEVMP